MSGEMEFCPSGIAVISMQSLEARMCKSIAASYVDSENVLCAFFAMHGVHLFLVTKNHPQEPIFKLGSDVVNTGGDLLEFWQSDDWIVKRLDTMSAWDVPDYMSRHADTYSKTRRYEKALWAAKLAATDFSLRLTVAEMTNFQLKEFIQYVSMCYATGIDTYKTAYRYAKLIELRRS
jgi:hypothetical protein